MSKERNERIGESIWKHFLSRLTEDLNNLAAPTSKYYCTVATTLLLLEGSEKGGIKPKNKELQRFLSGWRKQKGYTQRLLDEKDTLLKKAEKGLEDIEFLPAESYDFLVEHLLAIGSISRELEAFSPKDAKELKKKLEEMNNEFKKKTVAIPAKLKHSDLPWYYNRWTAKMIEEYKEYLESTGDEGEELD